MLKICVILIIDKSPPDINFYSIKKAWMNSFNNVRRDARATLITSSPPTTVFSGLSGTKPLRTVIGSTSHTNSGQGVITSDNTTRIYSKPIITPSTYDSAVVSAYPSMTISSATSSSQTIQSDIQESLVNESTTQILLEQPERISEKLLMESRDINPHTTFVTDKTAKKIPPRPLTHTSVVSSQVNEIVVTGSELENLLAPKNSQPKIITSKSDSLLGRQFITPSAFEYSDIIIDNETLHLKTQFPFSKKIEPLPPLVPLSKSIKPSIYIGVGLSLLALVVAMGEGLVNNTHISSASALSTISISYHNTNVGTFAAQVSPETTLKQQNTFSSAQVIQVCIAYQNQPATTVLLVKINRLDIEPRLELTTRVIASGSDTTCLPFTGTKVRPGNFNVEVNKAEDLSSNFILVGKSEFIITQP